METKNKTSGAVFWTIVVGAILLVGVISTMAQSGDIAFPTAITENQVAGKIKARDVGDARSTTYYFTFNGRQGDLFVNVVTRNLNGSVDIFAAEGMRPLANILVYADQSQSETGRVIYLRKPEKLILRVEGRTPNDDAAEFQIKFAGGFEAAVPTTDEPPVPKVTDLGENTSGVRVNSVGTIVEVIPKPKASPKAERTESAKTEVPAEVKKESENSETVVSDNATKTENEAKVESTSDETKTPDETLSKRTPTKPSTGASKRRTKPSSDQPAKKDESAPEATKAETEPKRKPPKVVVTENISKPEPLAAKPNPLANVNLVILFKDGTKVERPMTQVARFTVDQTTLTVVSTNGRIAKFSILEVASVTIQ
jgi:hypothetical protein